MGAGLAPASWRCDAPEIIEEFGLDPYQRCKHVQELDIAVDPSNPWRSSKSKRHAVFHPHHQFKFKDHYQLLRVLGNGSYANVHEAVALDPPNAGGKPSARAARIVAVKCFNGETVPSSHSPPSPGVRPDGPSPSPSFSTERDRLRARNSFDLERRMLGRLEHPHIVKMYECFEDEDALWIVLELCPGGELFARIASAGPIPETGARPMFRQMLYGVGYLHSRRVVHRDLKPENFVLLDPPPGDPEAHSVKLCDFGTAVELTDARPRAMERIGTLSYTAPEVYAEKGAALVADTWSLGAVLYVSIVGEGPFRLTRNEARELILGRIRGGDYDQKRPAWQRLSSGAKDLIRCLLTVDEARRLRCGDALRDPWVQPEPRLESVVSLGDDAYVPPIAHTVDPLINYAAQASALLPAMARFARLDPLQQLLFTLCAQMTPDAMVQRMRHPLNWYDLFFAFDADEDGRLEYSELGLGLRTLLGPLTGPSNTHLATLARALDLDGSGFVDWVEWVALALFSEGLESEEETLVAVFRALDRPSHDDRISGSDIVAALGGGEPLEKTSVAKSRRWDIEQAEQMILRWAPLVPSGEIESAPALNLEDLRRVLAASRVWEDYEAIEAEDDSQRGGGETRLPPTWLCCNVSQETLDWDGRLQMLVKQEPASAYPHWQTGSLSPGGQPRPSSL